MEDVIELFITCLIDFVFGSLMIRMLMIWLNMVLGGGLYA